MLLKIKSKEDIEKEEADQQRKIGEDIEKREAERQRRIRNYTAIKKKHKRIFIAGISIITIALLVFGTYNTFIRTETPQNVTARNTMKYAGITGINTFGAEGYLKANVNELFKNYASNSTQIEVTNKDGTKVKKQASTYKIDTESLYITEAYEKTSSLMNVYFSANVVIQQPDDKTTNTKGIITTTKYSFFLPLNYNASTGGYSPAGSLEIYNISSANSTKLTDNAYNSFDKLEKCDTDTTASAQLFLDNFYTSMYAGQDVSQMYTGQYNLATNGLTYQGITTLTLYKSDNLAGFNAVCVYKVSTNDGLVYSNSQNLKLVKQGSSWVITIMQ